MDAPTADPMAGLMADMTAGQTADMMVASTV
jgi:hypothetical protein